MKYFKNDFFPAKNINKKKKENRQYRLKEKQTNKKRKFDTFLTLSFVKSNFKSRFLNQNAVAEQL